MEKYTLTGIAFLKETDNAVLVSIRDECKSIWLPLSQVSKMVKAPNPDQCSITMTAWIAKQKGLIN